MMSNPCSFSETPFRLFKHRIQNTRVNGAQASVPRTASPQITQLILSLVSQCKHKGGMTMAELKHTLASEGYDVAKNNKHVTVMAKQLLDNGNLVQHKRNKVTVTRLIAI
ncbi:hypothetical protein NL108_011135 [Boleophthalmus pectinirostris]|nr:hypothetical protein NL108_011135 [Boleophthalmus pectinirostris]